MVKNANFERIELRAVLKDAHAEMYKALKSAYEMEDGTMTDSAVVRRLVYIAYKQQEKVPAR